ncbi:hypothetical protein [Filibacter tadaridae]
MKEVHEERGVVNVHKADSRPQKPDKQQWVALSVVVILIAVQVVWGLV